MFAKPVDGLSSATNPGTSLPLLDPKLLNFEEGIKVVNRTTRFVIPVPKLPNGGEPMVYPEGTEKAGLALKELEDGTAERGIVFFNGTDQAWQGVRGNGAEAILVNDVSPEQARALMVKFALLGGADISIDGIKSLLDFARKTLNITDFYDKKMTGVSSEMAVVDSNNPYYMVVTKPTLHSAIYIRSGFTFDGPVMQVYPDGAVIINNGKYSWGIDAGVFQRNFRAISEAGERPLRSLDEEFLKVYAF